jgi:hypothetical protein
MNVLLVSRNSPSPPRHRCIPLGGYKRGYMIEKRGYGISLNLLFYWRAARNEKEYWEACFFLP